MILASEDLGYRTEVTMGNAMGKRRMEADVILRGHPLQVGTQPFGMVRPTT